MVTTTPTRERKTAIIIGASRGLGLGLAREFARRGWQVTATARNTSSAKATAAIFAPSDEKIAVEQVDIDLPVSVDSLATRMGDRRFDLVFINAGVAGPGIKAWMPLRHSFWRPDLYNAVSPILISRRLLPLLNDMAVTLLLHVDRDIPPHLHFSAIRSWFPCLPDGRTRPPAGAGNCS